MTFRSLGLVPVIALMAAGAAYAQSNPVTPGRGPSDVGNMAYPAPLPAGTIKTTAPTARDTGNMAAPAPSGGVTEKTQPVRDTGNMALPPGTSGPATVPFHRRPRAVAAAKPMAADTPAPSASGMAAAKALSDAPGAAPVPYVDFGQPAPAMKGKAMMHMKKPMVAKKVAMKKPAAAPAAAAPTAPAPAK